MTDELADLRHHQAGVVTDFLELRIDRRRRRGPMQAPVELESDRKGQLPEGIVQLVRDPDALADSNRLGRLSMQTGVREGDRCVICRGPEHLDLALLEYPARPVADREDSDRTVIVEERDREHRWDRRLETGLAPGRRRPVVDEEIGRSHEATVAQRPRLDGTELRGGDIVV